MSELESVEGKNDFVLNVRNFFLNYVKKQYPVNAGDIYIYTVTVRHSPQQLIQEAPSQL